MSNEEKAIPMLKLCVESLAEINQLFSMMHRSLKLTTRRGDAPNYTQLHLLMVLNAVQAMAMLDALQVEMLQHDPERAMQIAEAHAIQQNQWALCPSSN